jgi:histone deacetylase 1/2
MQTRAKSGIFKPKLFLATSEPSTVAEALQSKEWKSAMDDEFAALIRNHTWDLVPLPAHRKAITCKCIYRLKYNNDGSIHRHKTRLVARGFN